MCQSHLVFIEEHVWNAALDFVYALAIGASEGSLNDLALKQEQMQIGHHLLVLKHRFFKSLGKIDTPVELYKTRQKL